MTPIFTQKNLAVEKQPGERLRQARSFLNLSLDSASAKTGIKKEYLLAMENEDYDILPAGLYGKNFIKKYAKFLKINPKEILDKTPFSENIPQADPFSKKILGFKNFLIFPKLARNLFLGLIILACFLYLSFYLLKTQQAPDLIIFKPDNNISTDQASIIISGQTDIKAEVTINGQPIVKDSDGFFSSHINLKRGVNEIIIIAQKKYGQKKIVERQILVQ